MNTEFTFTGNQALATFYSMGNAAIKQELLRLLIVNLETLQASIVHSFQVNDYGLFCQALQKGRGTINIINNLQLKNTIEALQFCQVTPRDPETTTEKLMRFESVCKVVMDLLAAEIEPHPAG